MEQQIQYIGERLLPGQIGHFAILFSFVASLMAAIAYFFATQKRDTPEAISWQRLGRGAYVAHGVGVFTLIGILLYAMSQKYYEYQYVWAHVGEDLPFKYIFAAFWEGQEGSFLLWMFWHVVLGILLIVSAKKWESPVMAVLSAVQFCIGSMLLGVYVGFGEHAWKVGSNPTLLLRDVMNVPIFTNANYVSLIKGNGLNPLLQNIWMTIHPPTLFLGFASTTVPFAYAIAGLWTRRHTEWLREAMPWALMSGAILGTGITMGAAWAYEALSFGGYWAWDPVENMSLVPWLTLVAGIHTNLVAKSTGHSIRSTYVFYILTFILVLYSTFLTRSGVLGDSSVHAFTEMGLEWQLVAFIAVFLVLSVALLAMRYKEVPNPTKEEPTASKEFWMFIGSLVLLFSALIITASTSLPVYNKIVRFFKPDFIGRVITDVIPHYNRYQIWIALFIGLLSGVAQFLRFREPNWKKHWSNFAIHTGIALGVSLVLTWLTTLWIQAFAWQYWVLLLSGIFTVIANLDYVITFLRGNLKIGGSVLSHIGFGLMIVGIMASGLNKKYVSSNPFVMTGLIEGDDDSAEKNILLFKNTPMMMSGYEVTYVKDTIDKFTRTYTVNYKKKNAQGKVIEEFSLHPNILYDKSFTKIAASNPSTAHYWNKDIFTHIKSLPTVEMDMEARQKREDSLNYRRIDLVPGQPITFFDTVKLSNPDTFTVKKYTLEAQGLTRSLNSPDYKSEPGDVPIAATIRLQREGDDSTYVVQPGLVLRGDMAYPFPVQMNTLSAKIRLHPDVLEQVVTPENELDYKEYNIKEGETVQFNDLEIQFAQIIKNPENPEYQAEKGDIAVGAALNVKDKDGKTYLANPIYYIRGNRPFSIKDYVEPLGLHVRFSGINPEKETMQFYIAQSKPKVNNSIPVELATNSLRSDYIVLEAIEFPGINFFWIGTSLMMIGLTVSMLHRIQQKYSVNS